MKLIRLNEEKGLVLVAVLWIMALLLAVAGGAQLMGQRDLMMSSNLRTGTEAFYNAEAGLNSAMQELGDGDGTKDFDTISLPNSIALTSFGNGDYQVDLTLASASPRTIDATSTGTGPNGSTKVVLARFAQSTSTNPATSSVTTGGSLMISGDIDLKGTCGAAHSNGNLTISGNPSMEKADGGTASGTVDISGNPCIGDPGCFDPGPGPGDPYDIDTNEEKDAYEAAHDNMPTQDVPTVNPADFAQHVADLGSAGKGYILNDDGTVTVGGTCGTTGLCTGGTEVAIPDGWEWDNTSWKVQGNSAADGVVYAETPVIISGSPGSNSVPWESTIIARDSVEWGGNPIVKPYPTTDLNLQDISVVTGNDLKIAGNIGMSGPGNAGSVMVHNQIGFSGNPTIYGYVYAGDGLPTWAGDPFPTSTSGTNHYNDQNISGNPTIVYDCNSVACNNPLTCPSETTVQMATGYWRESY